jgi:hypothetical protein
MGLTMASIMGNVQKYYRRVGVYSGGHSTEDPDTSPVNRDSDRDGVASSKDLCPDSKRVNGELPFGCSKWFQTQDTIRLK